MSTNKFRRRRTESQTEGVFWRTGLVAVALLLGAELVAHATSGVVVWPQPGSYSFTNAPAAFTNLVAIADGDNDYVLGLREEGTVAIWPNASSINFIPTNIPPGLSNVTAIAAGRSHCFALQANGTVRAWGNPDRTGSYALVHNATNLPPGLTNIIAVASGDDHGSALKADGTVVSWGLLQWPGDNNDPWILPTPATNVPAGLSNVIAIAAGGSHNLTLTSDGRVRAWGNSKTVPDGLSNVIAVACSPELSLALHANGTVTAWQMSRGFGRAPRAAPIATNVPSGLSNVVAIATGSGGFYGMALKSDGGVVTWGSWIWLVPRGLTNTFGISVGRQLFAALVGNGSPRFTIQPASQIVASGTEVQFHARAAGVQPLSFQWQHDGTDLPDATNADFTVAAARSKDSGSYRVLVTNSLGAVTSHSATLSVSFSTNLAVALDATNLVWTTEPTNAPWFAQNRETHDGEVAAQSGAIGPNQESTLHATVTGPGALTFWWKVSSRENADRLWFSMDYLNWAAWITGETDWQPFTYHVPPGPHVLHWAYTRDGSVSAGADAGWLDEVSFTPTPPTALVAARLLPDESLVFACRSVTGSPFASSDEMHFGVQASSNLVDWFGLPDPLRWTNGSLHFRDAAMTNHPQRFYRMIAR